MSYRVQLPVFEGPLDLLLFLIKQNHIDIKNLPIGEVTEQYLQYLGLMQMLDLEIAGDFLVMAATLLQMKSATLLPVEEEKAEEEEDPKEELIRRLLEYQKFKEAATQLEELENKKSDIFTRVPAKGDRLEEEVVDEPFFEASLFDLLSALSKVLQRVPKDVVHEIIKDEFTVEEKMADVQKRIAENKEIRFSTLFEAAKDKMEIITIFMALLELIRLRAVVAIQKVSFGEIMIAAEDAKVGPTPVGPDPAVEAQ